MVRKVVVGDTVYVTSGGKILEVHKGKKEFFENERKRSKNKDELEELEYASNPNFLNNIEHGEHTTPHERHERLLKLMGNKRKLISKADGLDKEIGIVDIEQKPEKKIHYNKYRKNKSKSTPKRKICKCKK